MNQVELFFVVLRHPFAIFVLVFLFWDKFYGTFRLCGSMFLV